MRRLRALWRGMSALLGGLLVLAWVAGWGWPAGTPVGAVQQVDAARAVRLLTAPQQPHTRLLMALAPHDGRQGVPNASEVVGGAGGPAVGSVLPTDFSEVMGYRPVLREGRLLRADGGCSSPFGPTEFRFGDACRAHDLGYDLLRYADRKGQPLGAWARQALDDQFDHALHSRCDADAPTDACHAAATVYAEAVGVNSLRQGYGVPVVEGPGRTVLGMVLGAVVATLLLLGGATSRPGRRHRLSVAAPPAARRPVVRGAMP